ncbi:hypothetical protein [Sphingobacterium sp. JB170]|uniref:hypothetical protein n=1 Tax=Sphingobacterium sp. JB170 TaxID=1434842 RepID=UPI00097F16DC|nr:hypothetical protein [Sphingobacterium sp. JB170]SJN24689.1 hypothetical protein FM107_04175 [Sphingobacterium sp. JB170]
MRYLSLILFVYLLNACQGAKKNSESQSDSPSSIVVGNEKDKNGCLVSAGYTWSKLKEECIRPWEGTITLNITDTSANYETAAFVLIDSIQHKAELFLKEETESVVLENKSPNLFASHDYQLKHQDHCWSVVHDKQTLYEEKK